MITVDTLDLQFTGHSGLIAAFLVRGDGHTILIETGPASTRETLVSELKQRGVTPKDLDAVLITHVHLDHAGAAGWFAQQGVPVFCHPRAARHLVDPSRLIAGARHIYGDRFDSMWGETLPAAESRVQVLSDGEARRFGGITVLALDTPGHARHHHTFVVGDYCFAGDVAGVCLLAPRYLSVASAPPQFECQPLLDSLERLRALQCPHLMLTHFGRVADPQEHLRRYGERVKAVTAQVTQWMEEGCDSLAIQQRYEASERAQAKHDGVSESLWDLHEQINSTAMCAEGIRLSLTRSS